MRLPRKDERSAFEALSGAPGTKGAAHFIHGEECDLERKSLAVSCGGITFAPSIAVALRNNMIMT